MSDRAGIELRIAISGLAVSMIGVGLEFYFFALSPLQLKPIATFLGYCYIIAGTSVIAVGAWLLFRIRGHLEHLYGLVSPQQIPQPFIIQVQMPSALQINASVNLSGELRVDPKRKCEDAEKKDTTR